MEAVGTDGGAPSVDVEIVDCGPAAEEDIGRITDENKLLSLNKGA